MDKAQICTGKMTQGETPNWEPLLSVVGEELAGDFMWMFEVALSIGTMIQAYKHIDTRRYVHLDSNGTGYVYEETDRYRSVDVADVLAVVFASPPHLAGVAAEQIKHIVVGSGMPAAR
jgi:hypothetical protein